MFGKLSRLQGKLDLMLSQISTQTQEEEEPVTQQPLLQYEEGKQYFHKMLRKFLGG